MMKSQLLIVDLIRTWRCGRLGAEDTVIELEVDYGRLSLVTREPEYFGNAEFEMMVLFDKDRAIDEHPPCDAMIHQLMRSFAYHWGLTIKVIRHEGLTTTVEFKSSDKTQNLNNWDWVDVIAPKADPI